MFCSQISNKAHYSDFMLLARWHNGIWHIKPTPQIHKAHVLEYTLNI